MLSIALFGIINTDEVIIGLIESTVISGEQSQPCEALPFRAKRGAKPAVSAVEPSKGLNYMDIILVLFKKNGLQKTFSLPSNVTVIGRRQDCDLCIPLKSVSRRHCQLNSNKDTLKIRDLDSHNGTYLNNNRIDEATIKAGDYLKIGPLIFLIQIDGNPEEIVPPKQPAQKPVQKPEPKIEADEESFAELELDESDSDLTKIEDL